MNNTSSSSSIFLSNFKVLIVTTGKDLTKFLDTLRNNAKYIGDILVVTYPNDNIEIIKQYKNIISVNTIRVYNEISHDRFRAFYEALVEQHIGSMYDIIMCIDGDDVWFNGSLESLLELAKDKICYVKDSIKKNMNWHPYKPISDEEWNIIKDKLLASSGMFIGPRELIFQVLEYMNNSMKKMNRENDIFGIDMYLFNCMIYYYKIPSIEVGAKWNTGATQLKNKYRHTDIIIHNPCTVAKGELIE